MTVRSCVNAVTIEYIVFPTPELSAMRGYSLEFETRLTTGEIKQFDHIGVINVSLTDQPPIIEKMSVIIFQLGNVFTSDQGYYAKIAPIRICFGCSREKLKRVLFQGIDRISLNQWNDTDSND